MRLYAGGGKVKRIRIKDRRYTNQDANSLPNSMSSKGSEVIPHVLSEIPGLASTPVFRYPDMLGHVADSLRVRVSVDMYDEDPYDVQEIWIILRHICSVSIS